MKIYYAGGTVRDILLGRHPRDCDYAFSGNADAFAQMYPKAKRVNRAGNTIFLLRGNEYSPLKDNDPLIDVTKRDFTINAFLLDENGIVRAHPSALRDLREKIIRPASENALADDPVRVFRAARFTATFPDFTLHPDCLKQMRSLAGNPVLAAIAAEQLGNELQKALTSICPGNFLRTLHQSDCLAPWFSPLETAHAIPAGPPQYHGNLSVLEHTARIMDKTSSILRQLPQFADLQGDSAQKTLILATWMALCHDIGKVRTDPDQYPRHLKHEVLGIEDINILHKRLRLPGYLLKPGIAAALFHMQAGRYDTLRPGTKTDLLSAFNQRCIIPFAALTEADSETPGLAQRLIHDFHLIQQIKLPEHLWNKGALSSQHLRELRCHALSSQSISRQ